MALNYAQVASNINGYYEGQKNDLVLPSTPCIDARTPAPYVRTPPEDAHMNAWVDFYYADAQNGTPSDDRLDISDGSDRNLLMFDVTNHENVTGTEQAVANYWFAKTNFVDNPKYCTDPRQTPVYTITNNANTVIMPALDTFMDARLAEQVADPDLERTPYYEYILQETERLVELVEWTIEESAPLVPAVPDPLGGPDLEPEIPPCGPHLDVGITVT